MSKLLPDLFFRPHPAILMYCAKDDFIMLDLHNPDRATDNSDTSLSESAHQIIQDRPGFYRITAQAWVEQGPEDCDAGIRILTAEPLDAPPSFYALLAQESASTIEELREELYWGGWGEAYYKELCDHYGLESGNFWDQNAVGSFVSAMTGLIQMEQKSKEPTYCGGTWRPVFDEEHATVDAYKQAAIDAINNNQLAEAGILLARGHRLANPEPEELTAFNLALETTTEETA